jgi:hypothetical protein
MGGGGRGRGGKRKGEDVVHPLKVSLEDLYSGTTKKLSLAKNVVCGKCEGCVHQGRGVLILLSLLADEACRPLAGRAAKVAPALGAAPARARA